MGKLERRRGERAPLADKSTLNRLEQNYRWDDSAAVNPRYVKTTVAPIALEAVWLRLLFAEHSTPPQRLILDMDVTDDTTHGAQAGAGFNGYYQSTCYTPLYICCGRQLLVRTCVRRWVTG